MGAPAALGRYVAQLAMTIPATRKRRKEYQTLRFDPSRTLFVLIFTLAAIGCYAMSLAPITWVLISEFFPNRVRGVAMSIAVSALWIACLALTYLFPILNARMGAANTFWLFGGISVAGFIFILFCVPETKNKTLEEIELALTNE